MPGFEKKVRYAHVAKCSGVDLRGGHENGVVKKDGKGITQRSLESPLAKRGGMEKKDHLEIASLISYGGFSIPIVVFKNEMAALLTKFPYDDMGLGLICTFCVKTAVQAIKLVISYTSGNTDALCSNIALERSALRFPVLGGFNSEKKIKNIYLELRLSGTDATSWRKFCAVLLECQIYAAPYER